MKKLAAIVAGAALTAFAACTTDTTTNTNAVSENRTVTTTTTNANTNLNANTNTTTTTTTKRTYNANISEADYNKDKDRYGREAKEGGETIGSGLKDGWLWVKTKAVLAGVDDLRDSTINVDVNEAVITLRGSVANAQQKAAAVKAANSVEGKKSVKDEIKIDPNAGVVMNSNTGNANAMSHNANMNHNAANHNK